MADESDDEDLWAEFDDADASATTLAVSENLRDVVNHEVEIVHKGDVDEGKLTWEAPSAPGLQNSRTVNESKETHWYVENDAPAAPAAPRCAP